MAVLADPLRLVIGDKAAKRLASAFDLHTVGDLLSYYPRRYDKRGELTDLVGLRDGDYVTVQAEVASASVRQMHNRPGSIFEAVVTDGHGKLTLTFFGRGRQDWRQQELQPGVRGPVLRPGVQLPRQAPADPPGVRAAGLGQLRSQGGGVRQRADPGLPGQRPDAVLEDRRLGADRAGRARRRPTIRCQARSARRPACAATPTRCAASTGRRRGRRAPRPDQAEVGRGVRAAGAAGPAPAGRGQLQRDAAAAGRRRPARRVRRRGCPSS